MPETISDRLIDAAWSLRREAGRLRFGRPVTHVYNPLEYAWESHACYLRKFGNSRKRVVFLGMNLGPFGMVQTGVPFGEVNAVRDWMGISEDVRRPKGEHPKRPVEGFACTRSEISGQRLWKLFADQFPCVDDFFVDHFVVNFCPLAFLEGTGRNRTPDKLPSKEHTSLFRACDAHLRKVVEILQPEWLIGIGGFAEERAHLLFSDDPMKIGRILHPSPASPAANRNWSEKATSQLRSLGVW